MFNFNNLQSNTVNLIFLGIFFFLGLLYINIIPPMQSPDEHDHLKRAYMLSMGEILMENKEGESTGAYIDTGLMQFINAYVGIRLNYDNKVTSQTVINAKKIEWAGERVFSNAPGVGYYFPGIYLPQALALRLGQSFDLNVHQSYYLARLFNLLTVTLILGAAILLLSPSLPILGFLLIPLVLFQSSSTTQDGIAIALVVLIVSLFQKLLRENTCDGKLFSILTIALFVVLTSRINLFPLIALPFLLAIRFRLVYMWGASAGLLIIVLAWLLIAMSTVVDNRVDSNLSVVTLLLHYMARPWEFLAILFQSLFDDGHGDFYFKSFVGTLGWLETVLTNKTIRTIWIGLLLLVILAATPSIFRKHRFESLSLMVIAITSFLLTFFLLLITWTPHPAILIEGVQGRYLWFSALIFVMAFCAPLNSLSRVKKYFALIILLVMMVINLMTVSNTLINRYYLSSQVVEMATLNEQKEFKNEPFVFIETSPEFLDHNGFIDKITIRANEIDIIGWGMFSNEVKQFGLVNVNGISATYKTIERTDVMQIMKDSDLRLAGFQIILKMNEIEFEAFAEANGCIMTIDGKFGEYKLMGSPSLPYYRCP